MYNEKVYMTTLSTQLPCDPIFPYKTNDVPEQSAKYPACSLLANTSLEHCCNSADAVLTIPRKALLLATTYNTQHTFCCTWQTAEAVATQQKL